MKSGRALFYRNPISWPDKAIVFRGFNDCFDE
jgi:hypothetical protein